MSLLYGIDFFLSNVGELWPCVVRHGSFVHIAINNTITIFSKFGDPYINIRFTCVVSV